MTVKINDRDSKINKLLVDTLKRKKEVKTLFFDDIIASELSKILISKNKKCPRNKNFKI